MQEVNIQKARERALAAGYSAEEVDAFIAQNFPQTKAEPKKSFEESLESSASKVSNIRPKTWEDTLKETLETAKLPISALVSGLAGAGMASTGYGVPASGAAASAAGATSDYLINKFIGIPESYPLSESLGILESNQAPSGSPLFNAPASIIENTLLNEAFGIPLNKFAIKPASNAAYNILKETDVSAASAPSSSYLASTLNKGQGLTAWLRDRLVSGFGGKGSVSGPLSQYDTTYGQYLAARGANKSSVVVDTIENLFAKKSKIDSIVNTINKVKFQADDFMKSLTGKKNVSLNSVDELANSLQRKAQVNWENLLVEEKDLRERLQNSTTSAEGQMIQDLLDDVQRAKNLFFPGSNYIDADQEILKIESRQANLAKTSKEWKTLETRKNQLEQMKYATVKSEKGQGVKDLLTQFPNLFPQLGLVNQNVPTPIARAIINDPNKIERFINSGGIQIGGRTITTANPRRDLAGMAFADIFNQGYDTANNVVDTTKIKNAWHAYKTSDAGRKLFNNQSRNDLDEFMKNIHNVVSLPGERGASKYLTVKLATGVATVGGSLASGVFTGMAAGSVPVGAMTVMGLSFGMHQLGKLFTDPNVSRLLIAMTTNGPLNTSPAVASRILARALRGQPVTLEMVNQNGKTVEVPGKFNAQNQFVINAPTGTGQEIKLKNY